MLDNKVLIKEYVHGALKEFGFLSKLDIDKATEKIGLSYSSIDSSMVIFSIREGEIKSTRWFSEPGKDIYLKKDYSKLELPDGDYLFDVNIGRVVYSFTDKKDIDYVWSYYYLPTKFLSSRDDFVGKIGEKFYRVSYEIMGLVIIKNNVKQCLYKRNGESTNIGLSIIMENLGVLELPTWLHGGINYNSDREFNPKDFPYLTKLAGKI